MMDPTTNPREQRSSGMGKLVAFCVTVAVLLVLGAHPEVRAWLDPVRLEQYIESLGGWGLWALVAFGLLGPLLFLPRWPIAVVCGLLYGVVWGSLLANTVSAAGAVLHYAAARWAMKRPSSRWIVRAQARAVEWPGHRAFAVLFFMRAFPLTSFVATNILAGGLKIPWRTYIGASFLGMIPSTVMYAALGKVAKKPGAGWYSLILALLACTIAGTLWMRRKNRFGPETSKNSAVDPF
ncbi:MAG: TVP38/TMEM64 family protein [Kiritimatiellae bacterium]|nr:TVP38/TMEM64 family protein [Kiritimatiellia bacterium]